MTERWRKKLDGLDRVGPNDEVYERAKKGPTFPEPQSPMQRTSTRVVTAIAAFVVFALGISVFAIPALRLGSQPVVAGSGPPQPLWPWNSVDAVKAWKERPYAVGFLGPAALSSPETVASAFGQEVLGWSGAWAREDVIAGDLPSIGACSLSPSTPAGYESSGPGGISFVEGTVCSDAAPSGGWLAYGGSEGSYGPTTGASPLRTFEVRPCDPSMQGICSFAGELSSPPSVKLVMYQPIGADGPWAVLDATSALMSISMSPGTVLRDGSTVYASGLIPEHAHALLGYHVSGDCAAAGAHSGFELENPDAGSNTSIQLGTYARGQIDVGLSSSTNGACDPQPGYVFVAITATSLLDSNLPPDPLSGLSPDVGVIAFAAVPATFVFPNTLDTSLPPSAPPSSAVPDQTGWTTYTDPLGWTMDVPATWQTQQETNQRVRSVGDGLAVEMTPLGVSDVDDSSIPLDPTGFLTQGEGGLIGNVRGDGSSYAFAVFKDDGGFMSLDQLSDTQTVILDHMISSITFPPSRLGEGQDGWTAIAPVLQSASAEWIVDKLTGDHYLVSLTGRNSRVLYGPAPGCPGGGGSYEVRETGVAGVSCPDGTGGDWDFTTGKPQPSNAAGFDTALDVHDAVRSWDGWLLARIAPTPSPTP